MSEGHEATSSRSREEGTNAGSRVEQRENKSPPGSGGSNGQSEGDARTCFATNGSDGTNQQRVADDKAEGAGQVSDGVAARSTSPLGNEEPSSNCDTSNKRSKDSEAQGERSSKRRKGGTKSADPGRHLHCPRCQSDATKFCYYNNYNTTQPRYFCRDCQRYWTVGGNLRNVPPGSGRRKSRSATQSKSVGSMPSRNTLDQAPAVSKANPSYVSQPPSTTFSNGAPQGASPFSQQHTLLPRGPSGDGSALLPLGGLGCGWMGPSNALMQAQLAEQQSLMHAQQLQQLQASAMGAGGLRFDGAGDMGAPGGILALMQAANMQSMGSAGALGPGCGFPCFPGAADVTGANVNGGGMRMGNLSGMPTQEQLLRQLALAQRTIQQQQQQQLNLATPGAAAMASAQQQQQQQQQAPPQEPDAAQHKPQQQQDDAARQQSQRQAEQQRSAPEGAASETAAEALSGDPAQQESVNNPWDLMRLGLRPSGSINSPQVQFVNALFPNASAVDLTRQTGTQPSSQVLSQAAACLPGAAAPFEGVANALMQTVPKLKAEEAAAMPSGPPAGGSASARLSDGGKAMARPGQSLGSHDGDPGGHPSSFKKWNAPQTSLPNVALPNNCGPDRWTGAQQCIGHLSPLGSPLGAPPLLQHGLSAQAPGLMHQNRMMWDARLGGMPPLGRLDSMPAGVGPAPFLSGDDAAAAHAAAANIMQLGSPPAGVMPDLQRLALWQQQVQAQAQAQAQLQLQLQMSQLPRGPSWGWRRPSGM